MNMALILTALAAAMHIVVLFEVRRFFSSKGLCRESDQHIMATTAVGSVAFVVVQMLQLIGQPDWYMQTNYLAGLWSGFAIFNAALYYAVAKILADRRRSELSFDATDIRRMRKKYRQDNPTHEGG